MISPYRPIFYGFGFSVNLLVTAGKFRNPFSIKVADSWHFLAEPPLTGQLLRLLPLQAQIINADSK
jgi:hypothetical protein